MPSFESCGKVIRVSASRDLKQRSYRISVKRDCMTCKLRSPTGKVLATGAKDDDKDVEYGGLCLSSLLPTRLWRLQSLPARPKAKATWQV